MNPFIVQEWREQVAESCPFHDFTCNPFTRYRTADGSCNNLADPSLGAALTRQRRMMDNSYDDGIYIHQYCFKRIKFRGFLFLKILSSEHNRGYQISR